MLGTKIQLLLEDYIKEFLWIHLTVGSMVNHLAEQEM